MNLHHQLEEVFRQVFDNDQLALRDDMTASDIEGWDSVAHINLMFGIEQAFGVRFKGNELADMKNIGELKQFLSGKVTC
ncbi:MAG TPA: acyl carrier protein [Nitrospira sp.]|jgi:acyl carrier protein|nr:acyl carrier protein [Nitrospira sp.]MCC7470652.1 acyl carrier protein [Candidatus Nomurabacteria bacterium]MBS0157154.1 acyl carrier protein [Nitrospira sp.]MBS0164119.1 acyl carrier protein [Nitrospira sp.]MBS0175081.1 acyl carrier protein [Nitrospira sp.]